LLLLSRISSVPEGSMLRPAQILARSAASVLLAAAMIGLVACRVSGHGTAAPSQPTTPQPGQLLQSPQKTGSYSPADLLSSLSGNSDAAQLLKLAFSPVCSVDVYHLQYQTVGGQGEATTASGALMIPGGIDPSCTGARPIVLYAHGTSTDKNYDIANLTGTDGNVNDEGVLLAAV